MEKTFAMISLGCAKNLVNSEQMLYLMSEAGYTLVPDPEGADLAIVNTCGFIDAAKSEAIDNILEMAQLKKAGKLGGLIVTGCLAERYKDSIMSEMPEIDAVLGVGSFGDIVSAADAVMTGRCTSAFGDNSAPVDEIPRVVSTGPGWAYLRIAEGCNNFCAFCAIPFIRGRYRSRDMENIIEEARDLAAHGQIPVERFAAGIVEVDNTLFAALAEDAQAYNDYAQKCERFEKKLHDLELTRMVSLQMGPQTRLLQNNDTLMVEKIQSSLVNTIPLWKSQMVLALGMEHSRQATAAQSAVTETTNELLKKNADMLKMGTIATAKEAERSIVDIETLQHTNEQLVSTLDEVVNIQREGAQKRKEAEVELGRIEGELKQKLMELRS